METLQAVLGFFAQLLNPNYLEQVLMTWGWLAYPFLFGVVFAETGLLIGFFFPGDSLLFVAGFVSSKDILSFPLLFVLLSVAAIVGDGVGYFLGKKAGPRVFTREDSLFFKKSHLRKTHDFYERHGGKTIILARFIPIIRTFAPFVAGMADMTYMKFLSYNVFGGVGWVLSMTGAGYLLGNVPFIKRNFEATVLVIVFVSALPLFKEVLAAWWRHSRLTSAK
ncbi:MAG: VTT domain-containing protein [Pseudomonadota bacterium]